MAEWTRYQASAGAGSMMEEGSTGGAARAQQPNPDKSASPSLGWVASCVTLYLTLGDATKIFGRSTDGESKRCCPPNANCDRAAASCNRRVNMYDRTPVQPALHVGNWVGHSRYVAARDQVGIPVRDPHTRPSPFASLQTAEPDVNW
jgi:hypothetical protein